MPIGKDSLPGTGRAKRHITHPAIPHSRCKSPAQRGHTQHPETGGGVGALL